MSATIPHRVLVIDDNPDIHADFRKVLSGEVPLRNEIAAAASRLFDRAPQVVSDLKFEVDTALQGQEGLELVKKALADGRPYDVAFVDMRMPPGWDGLETIVQLWKVQPNLQTIISTAYSDHSWEEINRRLAQSDRFLILKKPFDNVEVRQLACALTTRSRLEKELAEKNQRIVEASRYAGMAEVATGVLHNVGNVLNGVNVAVTLLQDRIKQSRVTALAKVVKLFEENKATLGEFITQDSTGSRLPEFLKALSDHLLEEQRLLLTEFDSLTNSVGHIKEIVAMQQTFAQVSGVIEVLSPASLASDALNIRSTSFARHEIEVVRDFEETGPVSVDKHKALQILINLLGNAKQAVCDRKGPELRITVRVKKRSEGVVGIEVEDTGVGISEENLIKIFQYGFTTKEGGHGFGLHSSANAAREMGGALHVTSPGLGKGATFILELPIAQINKQAAAA